MFKKACFGAMIISGLLSGSVLAFEESIVTVDMDKLFNKYYKTELADAQIKEQADEFSEERRVLVEQYDLAQEAFQKAREDAQNMALSEDVRNAKRDEAEEMLLGIREQEGKIRRMEQQRRKQLEEQQRRMRKRIVDEISQTIQDYAKEQNYMVVFDASGQSLNGVAVMVYSSGRLDITDEILAILNKGAE